MRPTLERILFGKQQMRYLLRDEFTDTLAAGAVNGTPAVPGPGTRTVVDTNGIMSTAGGVMVVNGTPAANDRYHLGSVARKLGQVFRISFPSITSAVSSVVRFGFALDGTTGVPGFPGFDYNTPTDLRIKNGAGGATLIYLIAIGAAPHTHWFVARATGGWGFTLLGGKPVLLYIYPIDATATLFPKLTLSSATATNLTVDSFRILQSLYIPNMWYDSFTRPNGVLGNSETISPDGQPIVALPWTDQVGTWAISGNAAAASALVGGLAIATVPTNTPDVHLRIALTRAGGSVGGVARYQSSTDYLRISHDGTNALCEQVVAGVPTTLRTGAIAFSAGALIYLIVRGTTGWLFYNDTAIGASFTAPASVFGAHGLYTTNTGNTMDNFEVTPDGNYANEHFPLSLM